jgi:hypothetical protein
MLGWLYIYPLQVVMSFKEKGKCIEQTVNIRDDLSSDIIRIIERKKEQLWSNMSQSNVIFIGEWKLKYLNSHVPTWFILTLRHQLESFFVLMPIYCTYKCACSIDKIKMNVRYKYSFNDE